MISLLGKLFKNKKHKEALTTESIDNNNNKSRVTPVAKNSRLKYQPVVEQEVILLAQDKDEIKKVPATIDVARLQQEVMNIQKFQKPIEDDQISNEPYEPTLELGYYRYPSLDLLELHPSEKLIRDPKELELISTQIRSTLKSYNIDVLKISVQIGPTVTIYEIVPATGVRVSKIKNLEREIALNLAVDTIKVVALLPGNGAVGIEISNYKKVIVSLKSLLSSEVFQYNDYSLPIALGKRMDGNNFVIDITSLPHLLIAGSTGQGKSVCIDAILLSLLYKKHPSQLKFVLIDPRKIDLSIYKTIELHFLAKLAYQQDPVASDTRTVMHTLNALCIEMDNRYDLLKEAGVRNIKEYNEKFTRSKLNPKKGHQYLPFIIVVISEFADYISTSGKDIEAPLTRLAQLSRAIGIHLIISTQRPTRNIITGTIKANFNARIAFSVPSQVDSRIILDVEGAETLKGKGDMLFYNHGEVTHLQCAFVDTQEVECVTEFIGEQRGYLQAFQLPEYISESDLRTKNFDLNEKDPLFEDAARLIVQNQIGSTSLLQRTMKLGYNRSGRLMDQLEAAGIVGPDHGSKVRDVLIKTESDLNQHLMNLN